MDLRLERQLHLLKDFEDVLISIECLVDNLSEQIDEREHFEESFKQSTSSCKKYISDFYKAKNNPVLTVNDNQGVAMSSEFLPANTQQNIKFTTNSVTEIFGILRKLARISRYL